MFSQGRPQMAFDIAAGPPRAPSGPAPRPPGGPPPGGPPPGGPPPGGPPPGGPPPGGPPPGGPPSGGPPARALRGGRLPVPMVPSGGRPLPTPYWNVISGKKSAVSTTSVSPSQWPTELP